jgi:hypothetical protein
VSFFLCFFPQVTVGRSKREAAAAAARAEEDAAAAAAEAEAHAKERAALDAELRVLRSTLHAARLPSVPRFDQEQVSSHCLLWIRNRSRTCAKEAHSNAERQHREFSTLTR